MSDVLNVRYFLNVQNVRKGISAKRLRAKLEKERMYAGPLADIGDIEHPSGRADIFDPGCLTGSASRWHHSVKA